MTRPDPSDIVRFVTRWRAESRPCPVCASNDFAFVGLRGGGAHRRGCGVETAIVRCRRCTLRYTRPTLLPEDNPYGEVADDYFCGGTPDGTVDVGRDYARRLAGALGASGRLLEVGCGGGWFLEGARDEGWAVRGIDFTRAFVEQARSRGLDVEEASPETSSYLAEEAHYDAILLVNILEHLYDPIFVLRRAARAVRPGGIVVIGVPNEDGMASRLGNTYLGSRPARLSVNMSPTFAPFHVVGFTPKSLRVALSEAGLDLVHLNTVRGYSHLEPQAGLRRKIERLALDAGLYIGGKVGLGDAIDCWARGRERTN